MITCWVKCLEAFSNTSPTPFLFRRIFSNSSLALSEANNCCTNQHLSTTKALAFLLLAQKPFTRSLSGYKQQINFLFRSHGQFEALVLLEVVQFVLPPLHRRGWRKSWHSFAGWLPWFEVFALNEKFPKSPGFFFRNAVDSRYL